MKKIKLVVASLTRLTPTHFSTGISSLILLLLFLQLHAEAGFRQLSYARKTAYHLRYDTIRYDIIVSYHKFIKCQGTRLRYSKTTEKSDQWAVRSRYSDYRHIEGENEE